MTQGDGMSRNVVGSASVLVGVFALLFAIVPVVGEIVAAPAALLAIVLGAVGWWRADTGRATNEGESIIGLLLGVTAAVVVGIVWAATMGPDS